MKRHLVVLAALLVVLAAPLRACDDVEEQAYLLDEILRLSHEGVPDRIIIKQMRTMDFVFCLSAGDIIELRELGVSDDVLEAIIETSLVQQEERQRYRQTNVVVRVSPGYWSPWYRYPCGWGSYYDPFPLWYSYYYYPFQYDCAYSWYGLSEYLLLFVCLLRAPAPFVAARRQLSAGGRTDTGLESAGAARLDAAFGDSSGRCTAHGGTAGGLGRPECAAHGLPRCGIRRSERRAHAVPFHERDNTASDTHGAADATPLLDLVTLR